MTNDTHAIEKVVRDGQVAVLVSPGFGAGWSTWADDTQRALFAPDVVAWIEAGKPEIDAEAAFGHYGYLGGLRDIEIRWLSVGSQFIVEEYDGSESILLRDDDHWITA